MICEGISSFSNFNIALLAHGNTSGAWFYESWIQHTLRDAQYKVKSPHGGACTHILLLRDAYASFISRRSIGLMRSF